MSSLSSNANLAVKPQHSNSGVIRDVQAVSCNN
jgi:hypothetical protein